MASTLETTPASTTAGIRSRYWSGIVLVGVFVLISAGREVYFGYLVQSLNPLLVAFACFAMTSMVLGAGYGLRGGQLHLDIISKHRREVIGINVATAFAWIGSLVSLRYIEPAIQNATVTAIGPAITVAVGVATGSRRVLPMEVWTSLAIIGVIVLMSGVSLTSLSGVGEMAPGDVVAGTLCAVVAGAGIVAQTIYAKRLGEAGLSTAYVVALRFVLLVGVSGAYCYAAVPDAVDQLSAYGSTLVVLSLAGIIVPLYSLQRGIERSEPITVALIIALAPTLIFCMQAFDSRLSLSTFTLAGVMLTTTLVVLSVLARHRSIQ